MVIFALYNMRAICSDRFAGVAVGGDWTEVRNKLGRFFVGHIVDFVKYRTREGLQLG